MKCLRLFCCFWMFIFATSVNAQSYYVLPIKGLNKPISLDKSSSFRILSDTNALGYSAYIPLPFSFQFFNQTFNGFRAYADGRLSFENAPQAFGEDNISLFNNASPTQTIYAFWDQTALKSFNTGTSVIQSDVQTWTETYLGQAVQIILWRLVRPKASSTLNAYTYYAVRLYANSDIDILHLYGSGNFSASVGLKGLNQSEVVEMNGSPNLSFGGANLSYIADSVRWYKCIRGAQAKANIQCTQLQFTNYIEPQKTYPIYAELFNKGLDTLSSFSAKLYVDDSLWQTTNINQLIIAPASFYNFTINFSSQGLDTGYKTFTLVLSEPNQLPDADSSDNFLSKEALVYQSTIPKVVLHEVFSSSTEGQGKAGMLAIQQTLNAYPNQWNLIYYPMNFPNFGDPYYVAFAGVRFLNYGLNMAPALVLDGNTQWNNNDIPNAAQYIQSFFEPLLSVKALVNLQVNMQRNGQSFSVNTRVEPMMPFKNKLLTLRVALIERETYQNTRNNGEEAFYYVVKALLPNVFGDALNLSEGKPVAVNHSYTFNGNYRLPASGDPNLIINPLTEHSVENFDNIYAIAFVQDEADDKVWQSASSAPNWNVSVLENNDLPIQVYPNPAQDFIQISLPMGMAEAMVCLRDANGVLVQPETNYQSQTQWALPPLAAGMYIIEVKTEGRRYLKKLLIKAQP